MTEAGMEGFPSAVGPTVLLRSGDYFDLATMDWSGVMIEDVAHSLARICRFTGHTVEFYSVAEHLVLASQLVAPEYALEALLHDAHEAVVGDVSRPVKALVPAFQDLERRAYSGMAARFGIPPEMSEQVRWADAVMLKAEQRGVMRNADHWPGLEALPDVTPAFRFMTPVAAQFAFLQRYYQLLEPRALSAAAGALG